MAFKHFDSVLKKYLNAILFFMIAYYNKCFVYEKYTFIWNKEVLIAHNFTQW